MTADGEKIISDDKTVKVWSVSSGECLCTLVGAAIMQSGYGSSQLENVYLLFKLIYILSLACA